MKEGFTDVHDFVHHLVIMAHHTPHLSSGDPIGAMLPVLVLVPLLEHPEAVVFGDPRQDVEHETHVVHVQPGIENRLADLLPDQVLDLLDVRRFLGDG